MCDSANPRTIPEPTEESINDGIMQSFILLRYLKDFNSKKAEFVEKINDVIEQLTELRDKYGK